MAHPRSRGENDDIDDAGRPTRGSSPLTRGKRNGIREDITSAGLIPAHAGKTKVVKRTLVDWAAHPRSRGENSTTPGRRVDDTGSSPLTRGKLELGPQPDDVPGLIPAHAGKTRIRACVAGSASAHPRSRGENFLIVNVERKVDGSSPLTRGKHLSRCRRRDAAGLIPAHAGKTRNSTRPSWTLAAHPRSRGENQ